jgi:hypothetical protein
VGWRWRWCCTWIGGRKITSDFQETRLQMNWTLWLGSILMQRLSPQELVDLGVAEWPKIRERIPHEQQVLFIKDMAEKHLGTSLVGMTREERAALMNALLPLVAREFPLADLDLLAAFPSSTREEGEGSPL